MIKTFFYFLVFTLKFEGKSGSKEDNIEIRAKYSPNCCRIPNAFGPDCVSVPPKSFCAPRNILLWRRACYYCPTCSAQTISTVVCDQIANKLLSFVLLNTSTLRRVLRKAFAICKFAAVYGTVIIAFSLKRYCLKSVLLKSVLSV